MSSQPTTDAPRKVLIIGAGISGLSTAYYVRRLAREAGQPVVVRVLDAGGQPGGVIRTVKRDGFVLEAGPDCFVTDKPDVPELCRELGVDGELMGTNPGGRQSFVVKANRLVPIPEGFAMMGPTKVLPFLRTPLLSPWGKARALMDLVLPRRRGTGDESVGDFVRRRFGGEVLDWLVEPLVRGISSGDPDELSMGSLLARFVELERTHRSVILGLRRSRTPGGSPKQAVHGASAAASASGAAGASSGPRYGLFVSFREGMQTLVDALASRFSEEELRLGTNVTAVEPGGSGGFLSPWCVRLGRDGRMNADAVCLAVPSWRAADLVRQADGALADRLSSLSYASWMTVNMAFALEQLERVRGGFGFVVPSREDLPVVGGTFAHLKFAGRAPEGMALVRLFVSAEALSDGLAVDSKALETYLVERLRPLLGIHGAPVFSSVNRFCSALPVYRVGHADWVGEIEQRTARHTGLFVTGNAYHGHGVTNCVASARRTAQRIVDALTGAGQDSRRVEALHAASSS